VASPSSQVAELELDCARALVASASKGASRSKPQKQAAIWGVAAAAAPSPKMLCCGAAAVLLLLPSKVLHP